MMTNAPQDAEPGWDGLALLFFWWRWKWVHKLLRHTMTEQWRGTEDTRVLTCNCGMEWTV